MADYPTSVFFIRLTTSKRNLYFPSDIFRFHIGAQPVDYISEDTSSCEPHISTSVLSHMLQYGLLPSLKKSIYDALL